MLLASVDVQCQLLVLMIQSFIALVSTVMHCYCFGYMTYLNAELGSHVSKGVVVMVGLLNVDCLL